MPTFINKVLKFSLTSLLIGNLIMSSMPLAQATVVTSDSSTTIQTISFKHFSDLDKEHWAYRYVTRMQLRNVINGYEDGTFQPNKPVKQIEALIMGIRLLGLEEYAKSLPAQNLEIPNWKNADKIPLWAKQYIVTGLQQKLISPEDTDFIWNDNASRVWVGRLIIRLVGLESEAKSQSTLTYSFTDNNSIPNWAKGYVETGIKYQLLYGFSDNTYRPSQDVTRAQMATYLTRAEAYLDPDGVQSGTIKAIDNTQIIFSTDDNTLLEIKLEQLPLVFFGDKAGDFSLLKVNDKVNFVFQGETLAVIEAPESLLEEERNKTKGELVLISENPSVITIKDSAGQLKSYTFDSKTKFYLEETKLEIADLVYGDQVELTFEDSKITRVNVLKISENYVKGEIVSVNPDRKIVTIIDSKGIPVAGFVDKNTDIVRGKDDDLDISDLAVDAEVEISIEGNIFTTIKLDEDQPIAKPSTYAFKTGVLISLYDSDNTIRIKYDNGNRETWNLDSHYVLETPDDKSADEDDFTKYDNILIQITDDKEPKVIKVIKGEEIKGEVYAVSESSDTIKLEFSNGTKKTYSMHEDCEIKDAGRSRDIDDIEIGDDAKLLLFDGIVYKVDM